jgi:hypothetical protein
LERRLTHRQAKPPSETTHPHKESDVSVPPGQVPGVDPGQVPGATPPATIPTIPVTPPATPPAETPKTYDEKYVSDLRAEAAANRVKLKALEHAEAERQKAAMSETERLQAELAEAKQASEAATTRAREALGTAAITASAAKLGVDAALARKLVTVEYDADGNPKGVDEALAALVKAHPYLIAGSGAGASATNGARTSGTATFDPQNPPRLGTPGLFKS